MTDEYPAYICGNCGEAHGRRPEGNRHGATWHHGHCDLCGADTWVTEPRDFGHLKPGWERTND